MRRVLVLAAAAVITLGGIVHCSTADAQTPPVDPQVSMYEQLLTEANRRVVGLGAQVQTLQGQNAALTKQLEDAKKEKAP
jgi:hypothetical protein